MKAFVLNLNFIFNCAYVYMSVDVYTCEHRCQWNTEEGVRSPRAGTQAAVSHPI